MQQISLVGSCGALTARSSLREVLRKSRDRKCNNPVIMMTKKKDVSFKISCNLDKTDIIKTAKSISNEEFEKMFNSFNPDNIYKKEEIIKPPDYNPDLWNDKGAIQYSTNCYAYVLNIRQIPIGVQGINGFAIQPGNLSGRVLNTRVIDPIEIIDNSKSDAKSTGGIFVEALPGVECPNGGWKVALVYNSYGDYHWYREHSDGTWSHKPGKKEVTNKDSSGKVITDPRKCDRHYGATNYNKFGGFFYIKLGVI